MLALMAFIYVTSFFCERFGIVFGDENDGIFFLGNGTGEGERAVFVAMVFDGLSGIQLKNFNAFLVRFISVVQSKAIAMKLNPRLSNRSLFKWTQMFP